MPKIYDTPSTKNDAARITKLTQKYSTMSAGSLFISRSKGQRPRSQDTKNCWRGSLHSCECCLLPVLSGLFVFPRLWDNMLAEWQQWLSSRKKTCYNHLQKFFLGVSAHPGVTPLKKNANNNNNNEKKPALTRVQSPRRRCLWLVTLTFDILTPQN